MTKLLVKKGTEVLAVNYENNERPAIVEKVVKEDKYYSMQHVTVDPVGQLGEHQLSHSLGGQFARAGFYGFQLPENDNGYATMLVHKNDVEELRG